MIEMRWVASDRNDWEKVLQYRQRKLEHGNFAFPSTSAISPKMGEVRFCSYWGEWSEWIDVPTVKDSTA